MRFILVLACASVGLVTSLSLPKNARDLLPDPILNISIPVPHRNHTNATSSGWPDAPFTTKISGSEVIDGVTESIFLTIDRYSVPEKYPFQSATISDGIKKIQETIKTLGVPDDTYIDGARTFTSGFVNARFSAAKRNTNGQGITIELAREMLGTIAGFEMIYGPRGFSFAAVQSMASDGSKNVIGYFSFWIMTEATTVQNFGRL